MTNQARNADHKHFSHSALPTRERLIWPGQALVAVPIILHFECMAFDAPPESIQDTRWKERRQPDLRLCAWYEYGNRVAMFRVLDLLDRYGLRVTVAANALACERYPLLVDTFITRGYEIAAHGVAANQMISSAMSEEAERAFILDALARIQTICGTVPTGWIGQDFGESFRTPAMLAERGMQYVADWPNDDQP
jgi:allantoinase